MNTTLAEFLEQVLSTAWRRRTLILVPLCVFLALSAVVTVFWPRVYASTALIMLQERGDRNPLRPSAGVSLDARLKVDEFETLLKSDRVLSSSLRDLYGENLADLKAPPDAALRDLRSALTVKLIGNDFIEIEMRDGEAAGLGTRLRTITTRFLENLMTSDEPIRTARQFAMENRRIEMEQTKKALDSLQERLESNHKPSRTEVEAAVTLVAQAKSAADAASAELEATARRLFGASLDKQTIAEAVNAERKRLAAITTADPANNSETQLARHALTALEALAVKYRDAAGELDKAQQVLVKTQADHAMTQSLLAERQKLEGRLRRVTFQYEQHKKRATLPAGSAATPLGLSAPELIRIIDEPKDPVLPINSALKIILACIGAGLALGMGLAVVAEQLDQRIVSIRDIRKVTEAPLVARLPRLDSQTSEALREPARAPPLVTRLITRNGKGRSPAAKGAAE